MMSTLCGSAAAIAPSAGLTARTWFVLDRAARPVRQADLTKATLYHSLHALPPTQPRQKATSRAADGLETRRLKAGGLLRGEWGLGYLTANVDTIPGGILTYSQAGAKFGYSRLWTLDPDHRSR